MAVGVGVARRNVAYIAVLIEGLRIGGRSRSKAGLLADCKTQTARIENGVWIVG